MLLKIFKLRWLHRWYRAVERVGTDIVLSSHEIKRAGWKFWLKACSSTFLSWSSRYLVANALIMAFFSVSDQFLLFARQLVMWIMMLVMPTPGGSGFAEYIFSTYCRDLIEVPVAMQLGAATLIAVLWRLVTYYPYLVAGCDHLPALDQTEIRQQQVVNGPVPTCLRYRNALLNRLLCVAKVPDVDKKIISPVFGTFLFSGRGVSLRT